VRSRLRISEACPLILPFHAALDVAREAFREQGGLEDRHHRPRHRPGVRRQDRPPRPARAGLKHPERFAQKLKVLLTLHNHVLTQLLNAPAVDYQTVYDEAMRHAECIRP
jgi:adenylosuccinate synthase